MDGEISDGKKRSFEDAEICNSNVLFTLMAINPNKFKNVLSFQVLKGHSKKSNSLKQYINLT
jgi:hypothetical protein